MQDSSSGLYYIFARYMDPELGRFVSLDPQLGSLSAPQSMNRYVYCVNNPLRYVDPTGMWLESLFDIGCIIYDMYELKKNPTWGNAGWLLLDIGCLILPGVPALSPVLKTWKWFDKANDARKIADRGEDLSDIARHADDLPMPHTPVKSADELAEMLKNAPSVRNSFSSYKIVHHEKAFHGYRYTGGPGDWGTQKFYLSMRRASDELGIEAVKTQKYRFPAGWYVEGPHSGFNWKTGMSTFKGGGAQFWSPGVGSMLQKVPWWCPF